MNEFRENLIDKMIYHIGYEDERTIRIAELCEIFPEDKLHDEILAAAVRGFVDNPATEDDEEDLASRWDYRNRK